MAYDFTTLSPDDFENLSADLLSREWGTRLESFKSGKDSGIDLRNSRVLAGMPTTIVQCKRYAPHKFAELLRSIKKEKKKLDIIKPERYVLVTSVGLSPENKDALVTELSPWCQSTGDVYGASEINGLLRDHPETERSNFKLWISSTAVLERVLHSRVFNVTQATIESTKACLSKIVIHDGFHRALEMLRREHHVLIVGNPGIGKTTLAKVLLCHYMREEYEPVCVVGNIEDAWDLVQEPPPANRKMVVFYDDFLGRLRFDSQRFGKNEEHSLLEFLNHVRRSSNLRLILTTREYILADAQRIHGAFDSHAAEILKCTLSLEDYSKMHRAKMLFNHLYFSDLPDSRLDRLIRHKVYRSIVAHEHFNPRIVETISMHANSLALSDDEYVRFVQQEFDNPSKIWEHPFKYDISRVAQEILVLLWSFGGTAELEILKSAVLQLCRGNYLQDFPTLFVDALRQLDGNFISTNRYPSVRAKDGESIVVQFHNPSVEEFVENFLLSDSSRLQRLTSGVVCFLQVQTLVSHTIMALADKHVLPKLGLPFWTALRQAAALSEHIPGGYLVNHWAAGGLAQRVWDTGQAEQARQTLVLLEIESKAKISDSRFGNIQSRLITKEGWSLLMRGISSDESIAYGLSAIHKWAMESDWPAETKALCHESLRQAVAELVRDKEEVWCCTMCTLRILAGLISHGGSIMTTDESIAFASAAEVVVETIKDNSSSSSDVNGEADELDRLGEICGFDPDYQVTSLRDRAAELAEREDGSRSSELEGRRFDSGQPDPEFDVDSLFAGLLDR